MNSEKWNRLKDVFSGAADLSPVERERFLASYGNEEAEIIAEVRRLLAADEKSDFEKPLAAVAHWWFADETESLIGGKIGDYTIKREIGRGGMGIVYEAAREIEDASQTVALKILQKGIESETLLKRFRHERQILASLEHPNIARLLDGGRDRDGSPFLAMEFVNGAPVDEFCHEKKLSVTERLQLFLQICRAVSFAHSRLVVHRDLKPSNILVARDGTVKLLDFGISKILSDEEKSENQTVTRFGMMTPEYASPEQIRGERLTTASDIYSLGLILFELLTGGRAYDFPNNRADEMAKIICESEPPRPSSVVSTNFRFQSSKSENRSATRGAKQTNGGERRPTDSKFKIKYQKSLRGDLDNIILKALRKEPARRYVSVEQFANDIRRHLDGLPVIARADTFAYRFSKFVTRHRVAVIAAMLIFFVLAGGIAATGWQWRRAERQRKIAEQRFRQVRELANNIVFKYYDEAEKLPNSTLMRQMFVDDSLAYFNSLAQEANADDQLKSELARTFLRIGRVQGRSASPNLGDTARSIENYRRGIELLEPLVEESADTVLQGNLVAAYADYAVILRQNGQETDAAVAFRKAVALAEKFSEAAPGDENLFVKITPVYLFYGETLPVGADAGENIPVFDKVIEDSERFLEKHPDDVRAGNYLAIGYEHKGNALLMLARSARELEDHMAAKKYLDEAGKSFGRYVEIAEKMRSVHPENVLSPALYASAKISQAAYFTETGDYMKALENLRQSLDFYGALLEKDYAHVGLKTYVADIEQRFGIVYLRLGDASKAEETFARAIDLMNKVVQIDPNNFDFAKQRAAIKCNRADEVLRRQNTTKARRYYDEAFVELFAVAQPKDANYARSVQAIYYEKLGNCLFAESKTHNAAAEYQKAIEIWRQTPMLNLSGNIEKNKTEILEGKIARCLIARAKLPHRKNSG